MAASAYEEGGERLTGYRNNSARMDKSTALPNKKPLRWDFCLTVRRPENISGGSVARMGVPWHTKLQK